MTGTGPGKECAPWYTDGLAFECTRCGHCCTGEPGTVFVTDDEIERLRRHLAMTEEAFRAVHTRTLSSGAVVLREERNHDCTFWRAASPESEGGCSVYAHRPRQCRTWPFWNDNLESEAAWRAAAKGCPGMRGGPLHSAARIAEQAAADGTLSAEVRSGRIRRGGRLP